LCDSREIVLENLRAINRKRNKPEIERKEDENCQKARRVQADPECYILNGELGEMCTLESMEIEIIRHLYDYWACDINQGWEKQLKLDENAIAVLYHEGLVDKQVSQELVRLSERGVGAVLFGLQNADKISDLL
jgi:hypothetical protein